MTAEKSAGFERLVKNDVVLTVNQNLRLDFQLQLGSISQQVTVTAEAPLVDTRSATVSGLVDDRRVVDLPLNGRNVIALAATVPGVLNVSAPQRLDDARSGPAMNVNGGQINMNSFTFDGGYFINPSRNTPMNYPPPDALQEFRILTSSFSAEYGRNMGSQVNVASRAGSNDFHGSLWQILGARNGRVIPVCSEVPMVSAGLPLKSSGTESLADEGRDSVPGEGSVVGWTSRGRFTAEDYCRSSLRLKDRRVSLGGHSVGWPWFSRSAVH